MRKIIISKLRGQDVKYIDGAWEKIKKCHNCNQEHNEQEPDKCIGYLPGVKNACCGHGDIQENYIQFIDGTVIRGQDSKIIQDILRKYKK